MGPPASQPANQLAKMSKWLRTPLSLSRHIYIYTWLFGLAGWLAGWWAHTIPLPFPYHSLTIPLPFPYHSLTARVPTWQQDVRGAIWRLLVAHTIPIPFPYHSLTIPLPIRCEAPKMAQDGIQDGQHGLQDGEFCNFHCLQYYHLPRPTLGLQLPYGRYRRRLYDSHSTPRWPEITILVYWGRV